MMRYSIRQYVGWVTLIPLIVIAIGLELFFLYGYFSELDLHVVERAKLIASQLSSSSEYGVISDNQPFLQHISKDVLQQADVRGVMITNSISSISRTLTELGYFSSSAKNALAAAKQHLPDSAPRAVRYGDESLLVYQPIIPQTVALDELDTASAVKPVGMVILEINLARTEKLKADILRYTIAATAIFLSLASYLIYLASRRITYPIGKLSDAIQAMSLGNLETRVTTHTSMTELDTLSHGINHMAEQLQHERAVLQQRVDETTLSLRLSKEKAEQANTAKSKFLAAASHDLRQPIHAQGLFLGVLSRTELTAHQQDLVASARAASQASSEMLNTLLDFSRIEAGVIEPQLQSFRLQPLLNKIENELAPDADAKNIVYRSRETHVAVQSDPILLELILRNLVSNAIRYTERGGVLVACRLRGTQAVLEVWDTGIGIAPEHQQEVFREFHQLGNPERDHRKGLGLGLAIADGLAHALGHVLTLASTPQRGSMFRLALPLATGALPPEKVVMTLRKTRLLEVRILVIDDDEAVRDGMCHLLRDWGCECESAESIDEAVALARAHAPDLVISDYRLRKQRTGTEAIVTLRALLGNTLPALLITGDTAPERLREAQASGVPLLHKPVSPSLLYRKIVEVLEGIGAPPAIH
ncbi:MAG: response regulator [Nitrosomonadales bacterium]|nr:response regulator [Nitrosomonadales bacterium]